MGYSVHGQVREYPKTFPSLMLLLLYTCILIIHIVILNMHNLYLKNVKNRPDPNPVQVTERLL